MRDTQFLLGSFLVCFGVLCVFLPSSITPFLVWKQYLFSVYLCIYGVFLCFEFVFYFFIFTNFSQSTRRNFCLIFHSLGYCAISMRFFFSVLLIFFFHVCYKAVIFSGYISTYCVFSLANEGKDMEKNHFWQEL